ncbi:MAG: DUF819 family protein [Gemmatimonadetes bacterium]|nr:DUF819 family protein [Gemmatimonadota bacterium]MYA40941.1 DUF819 family protein [Gemmatimonadota bacterium]MYE91754.1 DUF819 family protein [Gemmatimonadota bacterium]MYJ10715.1 DUF819 family protein [Gemmatimonadota bacterium]
MIQSPLALAAVIAAATALAFWLDYRFPALGKVGASMLAIIFGAILSNTGLVPVSSVVYDIVLGPVTSVSIAWLLLSVDLRDLAKAGPRMTGAFAIAVTGTVLGALVAAAIYGSQFGDDTWRIAGALTGTYSGGSVNFVSVGREVGLTGTLFAGLNAADAVMTALWLAATLMLPVWLGRFYAPVSEGSDEGATAEAGAQTGTAGEGEDDAASDRRRHHPYFMREGLSALSLANLFAAGVILVFVAEWLGQEYPGVPSIVWLTTLALALGHSPLCRDARGAMQLGSVGLHFFFVLIGILSRVSEIVAVGAEVFVFTLIVVAVHGVVVFGAGRLLRLDIGTISVASQAAVGGPSSALAVAISREWRHLILPGVVMGLFGYAVGTYLGLGVAFLLR